MTRHVKDYEKHIACLESLWDDEIEEQPLSFGPALEIIAKLYEVRYIRLPCNTESEFDYNLDLISAKREYDILYLAFHGDEGTLYLHDETELDLAMLAEKMGKRFKGWIIHFGSCGTMNADDDELEAFAEATGAAMLVGYTEDVDWAESTAMDLLFLALAQSYVDMNAFWDELEERYSGLIETTGFIAYLP